jgi:class 3 adenylate cyclase
MADLPAGTVAFLFTDLEGSTRLHQAHPRAYRDAVARYHALLRGAVEAQGGEGYTWRSRRRPRPPAVSGGAGSGGGGQRLDAHHQFVVVRGRVQA